LLFWILCSAVEEKLRQQCEEEKKAIESEMKAEMQKREAKLAEEMEKIKADSREKERQLSMKMLEIEDECREKYDQLLDQEKENIRGEFASQAYQVNLENERRHDVEVRAQAQQLEVDKQAFEDECRTKYTNLLTEAEGRWKEQMDEMSSKLEDERAAKQELLVARHAEDEQSRAAFEEATHARFDEQRKNLIDEHDKLVQTLKDNFNAERVRHDSQREESMGAMHAQIAQFEKDQRKKQGKDELTIGQVQPLLIGQAAGAISEVQPAAQIMSEMVSGAIASLRGATHMISKL